MKKLYWLFPLSLLLAGTGAVLNLLPPSEKYIQINLRSKKDIGTAYVFNERAEAQKFDISNIDNIEAQNNEPFYEGGYFLTKNVGRRQDSLYIVFEGHANGTVLKALPIKDLKQQSTTVFNLKDIY